MKLALLILAGCGAAAPSVHAVQVPRPPYAVPDEVGLLVVDDAAFARFARVVRRDAEADLAARPANVQNVKDRRFVLAMLDALDGDWVAAAAEIERIRAVETDPRAQVMTGLSIRVWADARAHGGATPDAFRAALERGYATLPLDLVRADLVMLRAMGDTFNPATCRQLVDEEVGPHVVDHRVSFDDASTIVFQRYAAVWLTPVGAVIDAVLAAHGIELPLEE